MSETASADVAADANEPILLQRVADGIATLTLNRPAARNALSMVSSPSVIPAKAGIHFAAPRRWPDGSRLSPG
jgi:1,4-dihydroxy-2-naphthoyl-CoA synthase